MGTWVGRGVTGTCDLTEHCSEWTAEPYAPSPLVDVELLTLSVRPEGHSISLLVSH